MAHVQLLLTTVLQVLYSRFHAPIGWIEMVSKIILFTVRLFSVRLKKTLSRCSLDNRSIVIANDRIRTVSRN